MTDKKLPVLGVLTTWFRGAYQYDLIAGMEEEAKKRNINLIYFSGRSLNNPEVDQFKHNVVFDFIPYKDLDGLIIPAILADHSTQKELEDFIKLHSKLPIVLINIELPGIPGILINNNDGFSNLIYHLIEKHQYRKFAFIHGPKGHPDARNRFKTLNETIDRCGLTIKEECITFGNFSFESGVEAVKTLIVDRKLKPGVDFEALICSNDFMAVGALSELQNMGICVPDEVAVTGFDDTQEAACTSPPLTTVRQPIYNIGRQAIINSLKEKKETITLDTHLVTRNSCGCISTMQEFPDVVILNNPELSFSSNLQLNRGTLIEAIGNIIQLFSSGVDPYDDARNFVHHFLDFTIHKNKEKFAGDFLTLLQKRNKNNIEIWHYALALLENYVNRTQCSVDLSENIRNVLKEGHIMITRQQRVREVKKELNVVTFVRNLLGFSDDLKKIVLKEELLKAINKPIPILGINDARLLLYKNPKKPQDGLIFKDPQLLKDVHITKENLISLLYFEKISQSYALLPLLFNKEQYGILILTINMNSWQAYETLRSQISGALYNIDLLEESMALNKELIQSRDDFTRSAYMAGIAQTAVNITYNISDVLSSGNVSLDKIDDTLEKINIKDLQNIVDLLTQNKENLGDFFNNKGKVLPYYLAQISEKINDKLIKMTTEIKRAKQMNSEIQRIVLTQNSLIKDLGFFEKINLPPILTNTLLLFRNGITKNKLSFIKKITGENEFYITSEKNKLVYILLTLFNKAHELIKENDNKEIIIELKKDTNHILLNIIFALEKNKENELNNMLSFQHKEKLTYQELFTCDNFLREMNSKISIKKYDENNAIFELIFPAATY